MFCEKCGKPISSGSRFCQHCGAVISVEADTPVDSPAAPAVAVAQGAAAAKAKALLREAVNVLLAYVRSPRDAARVAGSSEHHLALAGVFAGINAVAALLYIWRLLAQVLGAFLGLASDLGLKIRYPFLAMLVTAIVLTVVFVGISGLALFACARIAKRTMDIRNAMEIAVVASIPSTALLLLGTVLGFLSWQLQLLCLCLAGIIWCAGGLADLNDYTGLKANHSLKELATVALTVAVVAAICLFATGKLSAWCIGEISVNGAKLADAIRDNLGGLLGSLLS